MFATACIFCFKLTSSLLHANNLFLRNHDLEFNFYYQKCANLDADIEITIQKLLLKKRKTKTFMLTKL